MGTLSNSDWYSAVPVKNRIINFTKKKEFSLLLLKDQSDTSGRRVLRIDNWQNVDFFRNVIINRKSTKNNWYISTSTYKSGVPKLPWGFERVKQVKQWKNYHWKFISGVDFFIDIDSMGKVVSDESMLPSLFSLREMIQYFDSINCPYKVRFSGNGFHIIIPSDYWQGYNYSPHDQYSIFVLFNKIRTYLYHQFSEYIDMHGQDSRKLMKLPYSWVWGLEREFICSPLSKKDIDHFTIENHTPEAMMHKIKDFFKPFDYTFNKEGNVNKLIREVDKYGDQ